MMKKLFYGVAIFLIVGLLLGLYLFMRNNQIQVSNDPNMDQPTAVLIKFITALKNDKPNEVYDSICEYDQKRFPGADYGKWVDLRSKVIKINKYEYKKLKTETDVTVGDRKYEICVTYHMKTESMAPLMKGPQPQAREFDQPVVFEKGRYKIYTGQTEIKTDIDGFTELLKKAGQLK
jgi:hypothetical protein